MGINSGFKGLKKSVVPSRVVHGGIFLRRRK